MAGLKRPLSWLALSAVVARSVGVAGPARYGRRPRRQHGCRPGGRCPGQSGEPPRLSAPAAAQRRSGGRGNCTPVRTDPV